MELCEQQAAVNTVHPRSASDEAPSRGWLQVMPHLDPKYGGLSAVVPRLASQLRAQTNIDARVAAFCSSDEITYAKQKASADLSIWPLSRRKWAFDSALQRMFGNLAASVTGMHVHGLWEGSTLIAASAARKAGMPYVLSAHGMLDSWALANKRLKKVMYASLVERRNINGAACMHALTRAEASDYRRFGYTGPIAIIPNGVEANVSGDSALFLRRFPHARDKRLLLFLGRIHYKKGVDLLVDAWAQLAHQYPDTLLVLAGPDSEGTLARVTQLVASHKLQNRVLFTGMLDFDLKWSALAAASYFVLPSYSEGLSVAALEALSVGVPLIVSTQCNLPQVDSSGAGWQVETKLPSLRDAVGTALELSDHAHSSLSAQARWLAAQEFSWESVAERMAALYGWVAGGMKPRNVELAGGGR